MRIWNYSVRNKIQITHQRKTSASTLAMLPSDIVRNLGVTYDQTMSMVIHVKNVCRNANYQIRNISEIRKYMSPSALRTIVQTNVISCLDLGNSLLYGLPSTTLNKLQHVQNAAARLVTRTPYHDHIAPVLAQLHWLPIQSRLIYPVLLFTYKALDGSAPKYITDMLTHTNLPGHSDHQSVFC